MMKNKIKNLYDKFKIFNKSTYGMFITISWILLIICLIIKLFGGNWFELWWDNKNFIDLCNYVDKHLFIKISLGCLISLITTYPLICIIYNKNKWKAIWYLYYCLLIIPMNVLSWYNVFISTLINLLILIILPIIITKNWKRTIISNVLILFLQIFSIFIRNVSFDFNYTNTFIEQTLIQIDYYIMLLLVYLYNFKRKENM